MEVAEHEDRAAAGRGQRQARSLEVRVHALERECAFARRDAERVERFPVAVDADHAQARGGDGERVSPASAGEVRDEGLARRVAQCVELGEEQRGGCCGGRGRRQRLLTSRSTIRAG